MWQSRDGSRVLASFSCSGTRAYVNFIILSLSQVLTEEHMTPKAAHNSVDGQLEQAQSVVLMLASPWLSHAAAARWQIS